MRSNWAPPQHKQEASDIWATVFKPRIIPLTSECRHPSFVEIVSTASNPAGINLLRDDHAQLDQLRSDLEYWKGLAKAQEKSARKEVAMLRRQPISAEPQAPITTESPVDTSWKLRDIDRWAAQNFDRIIIHPRAVATTKNSTYASPEVLYKALELLATEYTQWRLGNVEKSIFERKAKEVGVELNLSISPAAARAHGEQYFVRWAGVRQFLAHHLTKGVSRDPSFCLRIYFFFDEDAGKVVVGSMPAHLDTAAT